MAIAPKVTTKKPAPKRATKKNKPATIPSLPEKARNQGYSGQFQSEFPVQIYNVGDLAGSKGIKIFREMESNNTTIKACLKLKISTRLSTPWELRIPEYITVDETKRAESVRQLNIFKYALGAMHGSVNDVFESILYAMRDGYSVLEKNYNIMDDIGTPDFAKGYIGFDSIKRRNGEHFEFVCDKHGNITADGVIQRDTSAGDIKIPKDKMIIWPYDRDTADSEGWYGRSDLRSVYRYYIMKATIENMANVYFESKVQPKTIWRYPSGMPDNVKQDLLDLADDKVSMTSWLVPYFNNDAASPDIFYETLEASSNVAVNYEDYLEYCDNQIATGLLVGNLILGQGAKVGAFALSKTQFDVFITSLQMIGTQLEDLWYESVILPFYRLNFGANALPCRFQFAKLIDDNMAKSQMILALTNAGVNIASDEIRDMLDLPADVKLPTKEDIITNEREALSINPKDVQTDEYVKKLDIKYKNNGDTDLVNALTSLFTDMEAKAIESFDDVSKLTSLKPTKNRLSILNDAISKTGCSDEAAFRFAGANGKLVRDIVVGNALKHTHNGRNLMNFKRDSIEDFSNYLTEVKHAE